MDEVPETLTRTTAFLLQLALARAQAMGEIALTGLGLTGRQYGLLALLEDRPTVAQHRLGAALGVDRSTTATLAAALARRALVDRHRDPADRRAYVITLTAEGEALRARAAALLEDCDQRFLAPLAPAEKERLRAALRALGT